MLRKTYEFTIDGVVYIFNPYAITRKMVSTIFTGDNYASTLCTAFGLDMETYDNMPTPIVWQLHKIFNSYLSDKLDFDPNLAGQST